MYVTDPSGRALFPAGQELKSEAAQPGHYTSNFRASIPGRYQIRVAVPGIEQALATTVEVSMPQLEQLNPQQNRALLTRIADETGGRYFTLEEAAAGLPQFFNTSAAQSVPVDERLRTLWDRLWLLYLMVALLSAEWLTRKLLKLA
jgi:hypothetical protein